MRTPTIFVLLAACAAAQAQAQAQTAKMVAQLGGHDIGTVVYTTSIGEDHSWHESFISKLNLNGHEFEDRTMVRFSAAGKAQEDDEKETVDGEVRRNETIKFHDKTAEVTNVMTGETKTVTAPDDPPTLDPSDSWFVITKPKIGDAATASSFSSEEGWHTTTVTYVEDRPFKLGDQTIQGHLLRHKHPKDSYEELVDDHGLPLEVDLPGANGEPGLKFVRSPYTDL